MATCPICGNEFESKSRKGAPKRYCSIECRDAGWISRGPQVARPCSGGCGKIVRTRRQKPPMCHVCRRGVATSAAPPWVPQVLTCPIDGTEFTQARWGQKYCSIECRDKRSRQSEAGRASSRAAAQRKARERRLNHALTWDGIFDEEILERDGWRCQVPGCRRRPIRKDAKYPHPRSKSVDHIIPLSLGGDDTAANKRAAHLACNVRRGNQVGHEQLALIGSLREAPIVSLTSGERVRLAPRPRTCECGRPAAPGKIRCDDCWERHRAESYQRHLERMRERASQRQAQRGPVNCAECGKEFMPVGLRNVTCSDACALERKRNYNREYTMRPENRERVREANRRWMARQRNRHDGSAEPLWAS